MLLIQPFTLKAVETAIFKPKSKSEWRHYLINTAPGIPALSVNRLKLYFKVSMP
jgi:hypothetical protein